jgi:hypothetical protein
MVLYEQDGAETGIRQVRVTSYAYEPDGGRPTTGIMMATLGCSFLHEIVAENER